jgi:hypothetical protein
MQRIGSAILIFKNIFIIKMMERWKVMFSKLNVPVYSYFTVFLFLYH